MIVPSLQFLLFAAVSSVVFNLSSAALWRKTILLVVNLAFLTSFSRDAFALAPLMAFVGFGFVAQQVVKQGRRPRLLVVLVMLVLGSFFWLKRYAFIPSASYLTMTYVVVGLSYLFFRVLHLIIDSYQGAIDQPVDLLEYLNYTLNFTSLTSGPIQRYQDYHRMQVEPPPLTVRVAGLAVERIIIGYTKVAVISLALSLWQHHTIDTLSASQPFFDHVCSGLLIVGIYPFYLFANFAGYMDVVIGVALLFRLILPENFDRPFASLNFIEFWSRWHITLSQWLRSYVFNPLLMAWIRRDKMARKKQYPGIVALFVTFFLVGAWHGQSSEFLFFGVLQGAGVAVNRLYQVWMTHKLGVRLYQELSDKRFYQAAMRGLTFTWFAFTLLWFWASWLQIASFVSTLGVAATLGSGLAIFVAATVILALFEAARAAILKLTWMVDPGIREPIICSRYVRVAWSTNLFVITTAIVVILDSPAPDIVYKSF